MAPETLIFTTSSAEFGGDEVLVSRSSFADDGVAFIQLFEASGTGLSAAVYLTLDETIALNEQLSVLILDAQLTSAVDRALDAVGSALGLQ